MKRKLNILTAILAATFLFSSCIDETQPMGGNVTKEQIQAVPTAILNYVAGIDGYMNNYNTIGNGNHWDFGYPALIIQREMMGQDLVYQYQYGQFSTWYIVGTALGPDYTVSQFPWRWYYKVIFQANNVITLVPDPDAATDQTRWALGKAHLYRAMCYFDLGRLYLSGNYMDNPQGLTVPIVTPETEDVTNNPRVTAQTLYPFILDDLNLAATYLDGSPSSDPNTPHQKVAYGFLARVYLEIGDWSQAESYAQLAQQGYTPLTEAQWLDKNTGFNTPTGNNAWIFCTSVTANNDVVKTGIINWTSYMSAEQDFGYNGPGMDNISMNVHLYSLISDTDFRKKSYTRADRTSDVSILTAAQVANLYPYTSIKFRPAGGQTSPSSVAAATSVPFMRVEEMMLIEIEAAGRQNLANGKQKLEAFVQTYRDATFSSAATTLSDFIEEVHLQRRIELWGEGFATFDIKRLNRGITRSYTGTNHPTGFRYNTTSQPGWMNYCIVRTEFNNNFAINADENNPAPVRPSDSAPAW